MHINILFLIFAIALTSFPLVQAFGQSLSTTGIDKKLYYLQYQNHFFISTQIHPTQKQFQCDFNALETQLTKVRTGLAHSKHDFISIFQARQTLPLIDPQAVAALKQIQVGVPFLFSAQTKGIMDRVLPPKSLLYKELFDRNRVVIQNQLNGFTKEFDLLMRRSEQGQLETRFLPSGTNLIEILWKKNQLKIHYQPLTEMYPITDNMDRYKVYSHEREYMERIFQAVEAYSRHYRFTIQNMFFEKLVHHCKTRASSAITAMVPSETSEAGKPVRHTTSVVVTAFVNNQPSRRHSAGGSAQLIVPANNNAEQRPPRRNTGNGLNFGHILPEPRNSLRGNTRNQ